MWSSNKTNITIFLLFVQILIYLFSHTTAQQPPFDSRVCQDTFGNYTLNSTFKKNRDTLLSDITSSNPKINYGFYNFSVGKELDIVNGLGMCRPDVLFDDCHQCLQQAAREIVDQCPYQKDAIGWYDECMIRYTDRYIFGKMETGPWYHLEEPVSADAVKFNRTVANLLVKLKTKAASGDSRLKYGAGAVNMTGSRMIYAFVQCTPDLDYFDCYTCLDDAIGFALTRLYGRQARVFYVSCNIRYDSFPFYDSSNFITFEPSPPLPPGPPPPASPQSSKGKSRNAKVLIKVLVPVVTSLLLVFAFVGCYLVRRRTNMSRNVSGGDEPIIDQDSLQMDFEAIKVATGNFSPTNKLGHGGSGHPKGLKHKNHLLPWTSTPHLYSFEILYPIRDRIAKTSCAESHSEFLGKCSLFLRYLYPRS